MDKIKFFRRRQFVLGPEYLNFEGWKRYELTKNYCLTAHPDLDVQQVSHNSKTITLLGFLLDPERYKLTQKEILSNIIHNANSITDIINDFENMTGRFVAVAELNDNIYMFNDACGLKQIVYCSDKNGKIWCSSQAESLAQKLGFPLDKDVMDYINSPGKSEIWMPNNITPYKDILHLLPNHYLDFTTGKSYRFWPTANCIAPTSIEEGVELSALILKNSLYAACNRFDLKMGITAGIDSRKTLAAARGIKHKITFFTHASAALSVTDVKIPARLLPKLGIQHHVLEQERMNDEFRGYYNASATFARESKGHEPYNILRYFGSEVNILNSNVSETTQGLYWLPKSKINGEGLAILTGLYHPLTIREFNNWLLDAREACEAAGLNILALFHWEQKMGRWAAASFSEYDIAHDSFTPYNNRYLNKVLMGINERYRRNRMWFIGIKTVKFLWPEVLNEPINPPETLRSSIQAFIRRQIFHKYITPWFPLYEYLLYMRRKSQAKAQMQQT